MRSWMVHELRGDGTLLLKDWAGGVVMVLDADGRREEIEIGGREGGASICNSSGPLYGSDWHLPGLWRRTGDNRSEFLDYRRRVGSVKSGGHGRWLVGVTRRGVFMIDTVTGDESPMPHAAIDLSSGALFGPSHSVFLLPSGRKGVLFGVDFDSGATWNVMHDRPRMRVVWMCAIPGTELVVCLDSLRRVTAFKLTHTLVEVWSTPLPKRSVPGNLLFLAVSANGTRVVVPVQRLGGQSAVVLDARDGTVLHTLEDTRVHPGIPLYGPYVLSNSEVMLDGYTAMASNLTTGELVELRLDAAALRRSCALNGPTS